MIKGILKRHSLLGVSATPSNSEDFDSGTQDDTPKSKRVSFDGAEPASVFEADEWDRSPAEVTLRLTYNNCQSFCYLRYKHVVLRNILMLIVLLRDVVELRELNVSLVRTGPLIMERTPSRRPSTRQRTPLSSTTQSNKFPVTGSLRRGSSPIGRCTPPEEPLNRPSSPTPMSPNPRLSPTYQYHTFSSQSLPPLLEDASPPSNSLASPTEKPGRGESVSMADSYFTFVKAPMSGSPPGLALRAPRLKGVPSPTLSPPSPFTLASPLPSRSPSPNPASCTVSHASLHRHPRSPSSLKSPSASESPKSFVLPTLSRRASVSDMLPMETAKVTLPKSSLDRDSPSPTWKPMGLAGINANLSSPTLSPSKSAVNTTPVPSIMAKKGGRSLMGWEMKRTGSGSGKIGFGWKRKGSTGS
ncbi:hypothetical protein K439DRAFT_1617021 [Ramaria rubella]|nr:hypothetical protein K439DRAFT_1617021 [Ramaria rubella]